MIQRIQTLYIAGAILFSSLLLYGKIVQFVGTDGSSYELRYSGLFEVTTNTVTKTEPLLALSVLLVILPILSLITLLLFKKRKLQLRGAVMSLLLLLGSVILVGYYILYVSTKYDATVIFGIKVIFPLLAAILMYLGFRGILKDELLVRSYDRIR